MPNHFTVVGLCARDFSKGDPEKVDLSPLNKADLCDLVDPMPAEYKEPGRDAMYLGFAREAWGTKWGIYDTKVHELDGDGSPILIEFQCAWGPPNAETMRKIDDYLCREYAFQSITWIGHNPFNCQTGAISVAPPVVENANGELPTPLTDEELDSIEL